MSPWKPLSVKRGEGQTDFPWFHVYFTKDRKWVCFWKVLRSLLT